MANPPLTNADVLRRWANEAGADPGPRILTRKDGTSFPGVFVPAGDLLWLLDRVVALEDVIGDIIHDYGTTARASLREASSLLGTDQA